MLNNLRNLRIERGLSQEALGNLIGKTQQSIGKYESGETEPDIQTLIFFADYFQTSVDYILDRTDVRSPGMVNKELGFSNEEKRLLSSYNDLDETQQKVILQMLETFGIYGKEDIR